MSAIVVVLLVSSLMGLCSACCTPAQWEGQLSAIAGRAEGARHEVILEFGEVSYDATNNRSVIVLSFKGGKIDDTMKILTRYDNSSSGKQYVLDFKTGKCNILELRTPFRRLCIPAEAKRIGNFTLGLSPALKGTAFAAGGKDVNVFVTVQELDNDTCVPVSESLYGRFGKADVVETIAFINITPGIKNETVFDVPAQCKKADESTFPYLRSRDHYIMAI
ncbi:unnamed protein product [Candidula unifasciata]|uniref:Uncharacterized protein n=1 Tax=Candidula unifasciata TaxID=100452 RepID=A0A8S3ZKN1_9EUPU|nr:unnamed protein product [Candidula unifasciata]